jgi:quercetin dioxygenase-like cupin family protein
MSRPERAWAERPLGCINGAVRYSVVNVEEIEPAGPGGAVRFVRRELGVTAFGVNWFELGPGAEGREHDEVGSGQEEISIVVAGSGHWRVDGEDVPVRHGSVIRFDPDATRQAVAGPDGLTFVSVGAPRGGYEPRGPF